MRLFIVFCALLCSCMGGTNSGSSKPIGTPVIRNSINEKNNAKPDCNDYITELIRSSDFPFTDIAPSQINIQIDIEDNKSITVRVFIDTDGTGTLGWVKFYKDTRLLYNVSADLEYPKQLKYDSKWATMYKKCSTKTIVSTRDSTDGTFGTSLSDTYNRSIERSLPLIYSYELTSDNTKFPKLGSFAAKELPIDFPADWKLLKLPSKVDIRPFIGIAITESGQAIWYLFSLNTEGKVVDSLEIYTSIELEEGGSLSKTFSIAPDYSIKLNTENIYLKDGITTVQSVENSYYQLSELGKFKRLNKEANISH